MRATRTATCVIRGGSRFAIVGRDAAFPDRNPHPAAVPGAAAQQCAAQAPSGAVRGTAGTQVPYGVPPNPRFADPGACFSMRAYHTTNGVVVWEATLAEDAVSRRAKPNPPRSSRIRGCESGRFFRVGGQSAMQRAGARDGSEPPVRAARGEGGDRRAPGCPERGAVRGPGGPRGAGAEKGRAPRSRRPRTCPIGLGGLAGCRGAEGPCTEAAAATPPAYPGPSPPGTAL